MLEAGGVFVGDRVDIELEVQAVKAAATQAAVTAINSTRQENQSCSHIRFKQPSREIIYRTAAHGADRSPAS